MQNKTTRFREECLYLISLLQFCTFPEQHRNTTQFKSAKPFKHQWDSTIIYLSLNYAVKAANATQWTWRTTYNTDLLKTWFGPWPSPWGQNKTTIHRWYDVSSPAVLCRSVILLPLTKIPFYACLWNMWKLPLNVAHSPTAWHELEKCEGWAKVVPGTH